MNTTPTTITFQRKKLLDALTRLLPLTSSRTTIPITNCIVFQVGLRAGTVTSAIDETDDTDEVDEIDGDDNTCMFWQARATNLETFMTIDLEPYVATGQDNEEQLEQKLPGPVAVPCDELKKLVASMSECEDITITVPALDIDGSDKDREGSVVISSASITGKYKLPFFPGDQLPEEKSNEDEWTGPINWNNSDGLLRRVIARNTGNSDKAAVAAANMSEVVLFFPLGGDLVAANTDGYVGAFEAITVSADGAVKVPSDTCDPFELFIDAAKILNEVQGDAQIYTSSNVVRVNGDGFEASFRRPERGNVQDIHGTFQNISKLSKSFKNRIAVNKIDLIHAVNRVDICSQIGRGSRFVPCTLLIFGQKSLRISGDAIGDIYEDITDIGFEGHEAQILVNPVLLKRIIAELGDVLEISYNHDLSGSDLSGRMLLQIILITDQDNENFKGFLSGMVHVD